MAERRSFIREARTRNSVGVRELARRMGVTPAAVSQWERSEQRGTAQTVTIERALAAIGEPAQLIPVHAIELGRLHRREDRVTLELHRAVARHLIDDPDRILDAVPEHLARMRPQVSGAAAAGWLSEWESLARDRNIPGIIGRMLGTDSRSIDMRQVSPFSGVLSQDERRRAIERAAA